MPRIRKLAAVAAMVSARGVVMGVTMGWFVAWVLGSLAWGAPSGTVILAEDRFNVQQKVDVEWIYIVGDAGFAPGDELQVHDPVFHGMRWSKWGDVSPWAENCTPLSTGQEAGWGLVSARVQRDGEWMDDLEVAVERDNCVEATQICSSDIHLEAASHVYLVGDEPLVEGDRVHVAMGDASGCYERCEEGSEGDCSYCDDCGFETPDRAFPQVRWPADECLGDEACEALEGPVLEISADSTPMSLHVVVPSQRVVDEPFRVKVALMDAWGNAVASASRTLTLDLGDAQAEMSTASSHELVPSDGGWHDFSVTVSEPGVYRFEVDAGGGMTGISNPIEVLSEAPEVYTWWGDIHVHHGYSWTDEDGLPQDLNHLYARDVVGLDVVAESIKADGIEIDGAELWEELKSNCAETTVEGHYLVLLAFEWMGQLAAAASGGETEGHHNVYYDTCDAPFGTHDVEVIDSLTGEQGLWTWLESIEEVSGAQAITVPHAMQYTGYNYDVSRPGLQTLAEIYSEWGDNSVELTQDQNSRGSTEDMLSRGLRLGWIAASDNHDGWMGNPYSEKNSKSGLGAFLAPELSRAAIFGAMESRRTYATTGHRPILHAWMEDGAETVESGQEYLGQSPVFSWRYHGTEDLLSVQIMSMGLDSKSEQVVVENHQPETGMDHTGSVPIDWDGLAPLAVWIEVVQQDAEKAWSSPIWLASDCERLDEGALDPLELCSSPADTGPDTGSDTGHDSGEGAGVTPAVRCACSGSQAWLVFLMGLAGLWTRRGRI